MRRRRGTESDNDESSGHGHEQHQKNQNDKSYQEIGVPKNTSSTSSASINRKNTNNNTAFHHTVRVRDKNEAATVPIDVDPLKSDEHGNNLTAEVSYRHQQPLTRLNELHEILRKIDTFSKQIANAANLQERKTLLDDANLTLTHLQRHGLANLFDNDNNDDATNNTNPHLDMFRQICRFIIASAQEQNTNNTTTNKEKFLRFFDEPDLCVGSFHYKRDANYSSSIRPGQTQEQDLLGAIRRRTIYGGLLTSRQYGPYFIHFLTPEQQRFFFGKIALQDLFDKYPKELAEHQQLLTNYDERHEINNNNNNNENSNTASAYEEALAIVHAALKNNDNLVTILLGQTNEKVMPLQLRHVLFEASGGYGLPHRTHVLDITRSKPSATGPAASATMRQHHPNQHSSSSPNEPTFATAKEFHNDTLFLVCDRRDVPVFQEIINKRIQFDECGAWLARTFIATGMLHILDSISRRTEVAEYFPKVYHLIVERRRRLYNNHHSHEEQFVGTCEQLFNAEVLSVLQKCAILKRPKRSVTVEVLQESKQKNSATGGSSPPSCPQVLSPLLDIESEIKAGCTKLTLPTLLFALVHKFLLRRRIELAQAERSMNPYCDALAAINGRAGSGLRPVQIPSVAATTSSFVPSIPIESENDIMPHSQAPTHANSMKLSDGRFFKNIFSQQAYDNYMSEGSSKNNNATENHGQQRCNDNNNNNNNDNNNNARRLLHQIASEALYELSRRINLDDILSHICASPSQQLSNVQRCGGVCPMIRVNEAFFSSAISSTIDYVHESPNSVRQKEAQMMPVVEYLDDRNNYNFFQMTMRSSNNNNNGNDDGDNSSQQQPSQQLRVIPLVDPICLEAELPNCKPIARFMQNSKKMISGQQRLFFFNNNGNGNNNNNTYYGNNNGYGNNYYNNNNNNNNNSYYNYSNRNNNNNYGQNYYPNQQQQQY